MTANSHTKHRLILAPFHFFESTMARRGLFFKSLLMLAVLMVGLTVVGATLRGRPVIRAPQDIHSLYAADNFKTTLASLNSTLAVMAHDSDVAVAPQADPLTVIRRVSLALVGSGASFEELRAVQTIPEAERVQWWTSRLLEDQRWADYFAQRLSRAYVGTANGPFLLFRKRKFNAWLSEQLAKDVGYNKIVHAMISAEGLWTDTPQVNFVTATIDEANGGQCGPSR